MKRRAFSLAENLLALTLVSLVLILLLNLFPSSMATVRQSERRFQALTLADSLLEQQACRPFSRLTVGSGQDSRQGDYQIRTEIRAVDKEDPAWLKCVHVRVSWSEREQTREVVRELRVHRLANQG